MTSNLDPAAPGPQTLRGVAAIAASRAQGWRLIVELLGAPDEALVNRLRTGDLVRELRECVDWLGDESDRFIGSTTLLDVFVRRSRRRTHDEDQQSFLTEYVRLFPGGSPSFTERLREMAELAEAEAEAWRAGDPETGKAMRVTQNALLEAELLEIVPAWCIAVNERAEAGLYKLVPRLLTSYLTVESGRDFDRAISYEDSPLSFDG